MSKVPNYSFDDFIAYAEKVAYEEYNAAMMCHIERCPEWTRKEPMHTSMLVRSFTVGLLRAAPWGDDFVPEKMNGVLRWISFMTRKTFKDDVVSISAQDAVQYVRTWASEHPDFRKWSDKLSVDALFQNMALDMMWSASKVAGEKKVIRSQ